MPQVLSIGQPLMETMPTCWMSVTFLAATAHHDTLIRRICPNKIFLTHAVFHVLFGEFWQVVVPASAA